MSAPTSPDLDAAPPPKGDWAQDAEGRVLDGALRLAGPMVRWDAQLLARAAAEAGLSAGDASLLLPEGPRDLTALLWRRHDRAALYDLGAVDPAGLKVRARIRTAVLARVEAAAVDAAAVKASAVFLAWPANAGLAARLGWETADGLWRWAGDTATDENHYSKRAILAGVLAGTATVRLARGREAAECHLEGQIERVMRFEAWKAKLPALDAVLPLAAGLLGRVRYSGGPAGRS